MSIYKIRLETLIQECKKRWMDKRIVIIPSDSEEHSYLTKELDKLSIRYLLDPGESLLEPSDNFYILDFREIKLI